MFEKLANFATLYKKSKGRLYDEPSSPTRTPFQRDRDRIIHSTAFRRLMHKTQVFISPEGDHFRTRLTHSIEVAQIARSIARSFHVDEDLCEAIALAHDLGHTPFGHSGEEMLNKLMTKYGGFDHNDQALRVLVQLENRYIGFCGLNLCWETLEGVVKHNGRLISEEKNINGQLNNLPITIKNYNQIHDLELTTLAGFEAQIAAIADDIAYNHHDMDDGLRAGLFTVDEVSSQVSHVGDIFKKLYQKHPKIHPHILIIEAVRHLIGDMVNDVMVETKRRIDQDNIKNYQDVINNYRQLVAFSPLMAEKERQLKKFLFNKMYRADSVCKERKKADKIMQILFKYYMQNPDNLPNDWRLLYTDNNIDDKENIITGNSRMIADYIAGMTDRFAIGLAEKIN